MFNQEVFKKKNIIKLLAVSRIVKWLEPRNDVICRWNMIVRVTSIE